LNAEEAEAAQRATGDATSQICEDRRFARSLAKEQYESLPKHKWIVDYVWAHGREGDKYSGLRKDGQIIDFTDEWDFWSEPREGYGVPDPDDERYKGYEKPR